MKNITHLELLLLNFQKAQNENNTKSINRLAKDIANHLIANGGDPEANASISYHSSAKFPLTSMSGTVIDKGAAYFQYSLYRHPIEVPPDVKRRTASYQRAILADLHGSWGTPSKAPVSQTPEFAQGVFEPSPSPEPIPAPSPPQNGDKRQALNIALTQTEIDALQRRCPIPELAPWIRELILAACPPISPTEAALIPDTISQSGTVHRYSPDEETFSVAIRMTIDDRRRVIHARNITRPYWSVSAFVRSIILGVDHAI